MYGQNPSNTGFYPLAGNTNISDMDVLSVQLPGESLVYPEPIAEDILGDTRREIIVSSDPNFLNCISSNGKLIWSVEFADHISTSPVVIDVDGDGQKNIIFGCRNGILYNLDPNGKVVWRFFTTTTGVIGDMEIFSNPVVDDIDNDGSYEIIFGGDNHCVICLDPSGELLWYFPLPGKDPPVGLVSSPAIADINSDGLKEIIIGSNVKYLYSLVLRYPDNDPREDLVPEILWRYGTASETLGIVSTPVIADLNSDRRPEVLFGAEDSTFYCLDNEGRKKWSLKTGDRIMAPCSVADIDDDGRPNIVFGSSDKHIYTLDEMGNILWKIKTVDEVEARVALCDLDGDSRIEIITPNTLRQGRREISIIGSNGVALSSVAYGKEYAIDDNWGIRLSACDLDNDDDVEIIMGTQEGRLIIFKDSSRVLGDGPREDSIEAPVLIIIIAIVSLAIILAYRSKVKGVEPHKKMKMSRRKSRYKRIH
jgi:outer membrane protein assembly factor BamB